MEIFWKFHENALHVMEQIQILFGACLVWNKLPLSVKQSQSLIEFKSNIKVLKKLTAPAKFTVYNFMVNSD